MLATGPVTLTSSDFHRMHRLFLVEELFLAICNFLCNGNDGTDTKKKALARLARTCRLFHPVALDVLWSNLDGFAPLLLCLPAEATCSYLSPVRLLVH